MGRQALKYVGGLIGLYLLVYYASGSGTVISAGAKGSTDIIKSLQGR